MVYIILICAIFGGLLSMIASIGFILVVTLIAIVGAIVAGPVLGNFHLTQQIAAGYASFLCAYVVFGACLASLLGSDFQVIKLKSKTQK